MSAGSDCCFGAALMVACIVDGGLYGACLDQICVPKKRGGDTGQPFAGAPGEHIQRGVPTHLAQCAGSAAAR